MTTATAELPQNMLALQRANEIRLGYVALRRDVTDGKLGWQEALDDPRAAGIFTVARLLQAEPGKGPTRVRRLLLHCQIPESTYVDQLTKEQRDRLLWELGG